MCLLFCLLLFLGVVFLFVCWFGFGFLGGWIVLGFCLFVAVVSWFVLFVFCLFCFFVFCFVSSWLVGLIDPHLHVCSDC